MIAALDVILSIVFQMIGRLQILDSEVFFNKEKQDNLANRLFVFIVSVVVYLVGTYLINPWFRSVIWEFLNIKRKGLDIFLTHFLNNLPSAILNISLLFYFVKSGYYRSFLKRDNVKSSVFYGMVSGVILSVFISIIWFLIGNGFKFEIPWYKMMGNLFSNFYEEIKYRGLIMLAILYLFKKKWVAILGSSIIFGLIHVQYPFYMFGLVMIMAVGAAILFLKTKNLVAPWLFHQISDMILDTILKL